jgi:hypothetical protein
MFAICDRTLDRSDESGATFVSPTVAEVAPKV